MALQSNLGTKERTNSINPDDAQAWLDDNPQNKAENLTGKMHRTAIALNGGYEGAKLDREAKKEREAKAKQEQAKSKTKSSKRNYKTRKNADLYHGSVALMLNKLNAGQLVTTDDLAPHKQPTVMKMVSQLRANNVDVLTIRRGNVLVGWMLNSTVQKHRESA